jgi:protein-S-isoprenylcysteine O-methyltransferase Ste14
MNYRQFLNSWVVAQTIIFAVLIFAPNGSDYNLADSVMQILWMLGIVGWVILIKAIYDLRKSLAIEPIPSKNGQLETNGIYRYLRHPMYVAVFFIFSGIALGSGSWLSVIFYIVLILFFVAKSRYEEKRLVEKYPGYKKYMQTVGGFIPRIF